MAKIMELAINMSMLFNGNFSSQISPAIAKLSELNQKTKSLQATAGQVQKYKSMSTSLSGLREKLDAAQTRVRELRTEMNQTANPTAKMRKEFTRANVDAARLSEAVQKQMKNISQLGRVLREAGIDTAHLADAEKKLGGTIDQVAAASKRLQSAQSKYSQLRSQLSWDNMKGDVISSASMVMALKAPVQASMKFEQAMLNVAAVARPTAEEFTRLSEQAKFLGRTTQYTAVQAAESQQNLIRSGMSVNQVIKAMPSVLQLASAEGIGIEDAGRFIAKGLGGMNLGGEMAARLVDVLSYTSSHSNTDVSMLSEAFKVAAPIMASQNYTMEQVAAYLGILANKGFEGSEAGNALSSSLQRLANLPAQAEGTLKKLGISRRDEKGNAVVLPELMMRLYSRLKNQSENVQLEYLSQIFGKNYGKQMIAFMQATASGQTKTLENGVWNESFGWSKQSTDIRMNSLNGDIVALSSAWDGLMTRVGESIAPAVRLGVEGLTTAINFTTKLIDDMGPLGDIVIQVSAAFAGWQVVKTVYKYTSLAIEAFKAWRELHAATAAIEGATTACGGFSAMLDKISAMLAPLGAVIMAHPIIAIGTLVAAGVALAIANWEKLKAWWNSWNPAPKTALEIQQTENVKKEFVAKYGTVDFRPSYMKTASPPVAIPAHATGGILTTPHFGLVAEAGPEAVIPLSNKSRGIPLLEKTASLFGMSVNNSTSERSTDILRVSSSADPKTKIFSNPFTSLLEISQNSSPLSNFSKTFSEENSYSVKNAGDFIGQRLTIANSERDNSRSAISAGQAPVINITVNGAGQEPHNLAEDIAAKVREVLLEISSLEERVSFA